MLKHLSFLYILKYNLIRNINFFNFVNFTCLTNGGYKIIVEFGNFCVTEINEINNSFGKSIKNNVLKLGTVNTGLIVKVVKPYKVINNIIFVFKIFISF